MSEIDDAPLTDSEILTFGPCVESQVWTPTWLQEARAPIAVNAGRPKLGPVFNSDGVGKAVVIRPCMSRGRRVRGLAPVYTAGMLEKNASVFDGWPMFLDHAPAELVTTMAKHGRSVKELGGQMIRGSWARDFVQEDDKTYGYQKGGVVADIWGRPLLRELVDNNPALLHTSINAWPTSGKPGAVPWRPNVRGMVIEGIRRQPQGSVDFVVRGGAGGRLLLIEGAENDEPGWPEVGEWSEDDRKFVVSLAESFYASRRMADLTLPSNPGDLREWLQEHAPHLVPALTVTVSEADAEDEPQIKALMKKGKTRAQAEKQVAGSAEEKAEESVTAEQVQEMIRAASSGQPTVEELEERLREQTDTLLAEREAQLRHSTRALELINVAEGIPNTWKADLRARWTVTGDQVPGGVLVESEDTTVTADDGSTRTLTPLQVVEARVSHDLQHVRDLLAEARGKPRPTNEGGGTGDSGGNRQSRRRREEVPHWRTRFAEMGIAESEEDAAAIFGVAKAED